MATITKTENISLIDWQDIATGSVIIGATQSVATKLGATIFVFLGRKSSSAFSAGWPNVRIEGSAKGSGNEAWIPLAQFQMAIGSNISSTTLNGAMSGGASSCVVTLASNISAGDILFLGDSSTSNYELVRVKSVSGTTITFEEACTNAHSNGATVSDQSEIYLAQLDLTSISRIRAVIDNASSGRTIVAQVLMVTGDSIG